MGPVGRGMLVADGVGGGMRGSPPGSSPFWNRNSGDCRTIVAPSSGNPLPESSSSMPCGPLAGRIGAPAPGWCGFAAGGAVCARCGGAAALPATGSVGSFCETELSVTVAATWIKWPQRRHFMRKVLPATLSSPIRYFALQLSQTNFT